MPMVYRYLCARCSGPVKWSAGKKKYVHVTAPGIHHEIANIVPQRVA